MARTSRSGHSSQVRLSARDAVRNHVDEQDRETLQNLGRVNLTLPLEHNEAAQVFISESGMYALIPPHVISVSQISGHISFFAAPNDLWNNPPQTTQNDEKLRRGGVKSLNVRSTFAQRSLDVRSTFARRSLDVRSTFAQRSLRGGVVRLLTKPECPASRCDESRCNYSRCDESPCA